ETAVACAAHLLYLLLVVALASSAAAWTTTLAQAVVVSLVAVIASWAIDASDGFAALAWLGRAMRWSVTTHLAPMERGTLAGGAAGWFGVVAAGVAGLALPGALFGRSRWSGAPVAPAIVPATLGLGDLAHRVRPILDCTELRRASLPSGAAAALRVLPAPPR